jgi:molybdate transport system substrate-binding protein
VFIFGMVVLSSCRERGFDPDDKKELLIYCGITMEEPIRELAYKFEQQENCTVKILTEGSGTLYRIFTVNRAGDLYLPGSEGYIAKARAAGVITETKLVGYNRAALVVAKGNPRGISADINNLKNQDLRIVLGSAASGSIGVETKKILTRAGIYAEALDNALLLTSDSKGLRQAICDGSADLTLNWFATVTWPENKDKMDAILLPKAIAPSHQLIISRLIYSKEPELAKRLFNHIVSPIGLETFNRYGFEGEATF